MTTTTTTATITRFEPDLVDEVHVAAAAYLARYTGRTLDAYRHDSRYHFQWADDVDLDILSAIRPPVETSTPNVATAPSKSSARATSQQRARWFHEPPEPSTSRSVKDTKDRSCNATTANNSTATPPTSSLLTSPAADHDRGSKDTLSLWSGAGGSCSTLVIHTSR